VVILGVGNSFRGHDAAGIEAAHLVYSWEAAEAAGYTLTGLFL